MSVEKEFKNQKHRLTNGSGLFLWWERFMKPQVSIESVFGLWKDRNITKETIRKKAWMRYNGEMITLKLNEVYGKINPDEFAKEFSEDLNAGN